MTVIGEPMLSGAITGSWSGVGQRLVRGTWSRRYALQSVIDCAAWTVALVGAWTIVEVRTVPWWHVASLIAIACVLQVLIGWVLRLYRRRYLYGSFSELGAAATSALVIGGVLVVATTEAPSIVLLAAFGALTLMGGSRYLVRLAHDSAQRPSAGSPVIVIGAGDAGISLVRQMLADPESPYRPVGFVDDDPEKRFLRASGVRVLGTTSRLAELAASVQGLVSGSIFERSAQFLNQVGVHASGHQKKDSATSAAGTRNTFQTDCRAPSMAQASKNTVGSRVTNPMPIIASMNGQVLWWETWSGKCGRTAQVRVSPLRLRQTT